MKIAVIGSGIAGLSASWLLSEKHQVELFEKNSKLGGHTNTVFVDKKTNAPTTSVSESIPVDTGFLVHNDRTYPNLIQLFKFLNLPITESSMSLSVKIKNIDLEWAGNSFDTLFSQRKNLVSFGFWRMVFDILKFHKNKKKYLLQLSTSTLTLREFINEKNLSKEFTEWYLLPMGGSIWSCPTEQMLSFPARTFLNFCENHGLLQIRNRPKWRTVSGGNYQYIEKMKSKISDIHYSEPVSSMTRKNGKIQIQTDSKEYEYDKAIFACHPPDILKILKDQTEQETHLLSCFKYQSNKTYLHNNETFLPKNKKNWSSWNFESDSSTVSHKNINVSYWINNLQPLNTEKNMIVTLNPASRPEATIAELDYKHPIFDIEAIEAQSKLDSIQGTKNTYFCGAWTRYGFHEDGIQSAIQVAKKLGIEPPWNSP